MIRIVKDIFANRTFSELVKYSKEAPYTRNQFSDINGDLTDLRFSHHFELESFKESDAFKTIVNELGEVELLDAYINCSDSATVNKAHVDSAYKDDYTILVYLNPDWHREWQGYTYFFDGVSSIEVIDTVCPEPNKAVIFNSEVWHMAGLSTTKAPVRYTLAIKVRKND
jgi:Rps23 Pro-64 3,4-dihydroxylase Tpa1-like proline 4-hydroxylase